MKILISFVLLMSFSMRILAESREASILMTALREEGIDEKILESPLFERCKQQVEAAGDQLDQKQNEIRQCMVDELANVDPEQIEELSDNLNIGAVNFEATKNADSIREYLEKRIFNAIHGENAHQRESLRELKYVDQSKFLDLYESQITKNMILDVSRYCLENIGKTGNPGSLLVVESLAQAPQQGSQNGASSGGSNAISFYELYHRQNDGEPFILNPSPNKTTISFNEESSSFWSEIAEYNYCPRLVTGDSANADPCHVNKARSNEMVKELKKKELEIGAANPASLGAKYGICSTKLVRNMCEIYRCNNVYEAPSDPDSPGPASLFDKTMSAKDFCEGRYGITPSTVAGVSLENEVSKPKTGQIACGLLSRIETYKKTFEVIEEVKAQNEGLRDFSGLDVGLAYEGVYDGTSGGDGQKSIDQITSISSAELVSQTEGLNEMSEEADGLTSNCFDQQGQFLTDKPECAGLDGGSMDANYFAKIQLDTEAETAQYLKRLEEFNDGSNQEELREYLIKHGLHEYANDINSFSSDQLVQLVKDKYKAERKALINNMKDRFYNLTQKSDDPAANADAITDVAKDQIEEIKQNKERLETLLNYSNIVSSYLEVKDDEGNTYSNMNPRNVEREGITKYGEAESQESLQREYFHEGSGSAQAAEGTLNAATFINQILGIAEDE